MKTPKRLAAKPKMMAKKRSLLKRKIAKKVTHVTGYAMQICNMWRDHSGIDGDRFEMYI